MNKAVLYNVEWQLLRCEMLAENNDYGGWWTSLGVDINVDRCVQYMFETESANERQLRGWRVANLCAAVLLGYGNRADVEDRWRAEVKELHGIASEVYDSSQVASLNAGWDWDAVAADVAELSNAQKQMLLRNLKKRVKTSAKRNGEANKFTWRSELEQFISLLER